MDPSSYAFFHGIRATRAALADWREHPGPILVRWLARAGAIAAGLLLAIWLVAAVSPAVEDPSFLDQPPFTVGGAGDLVHVLSHNLLVLALHAMACVAGFIAGSSLPLQAESQTGFSRWVHERGRQGAMAFVVCATAFSLGSQAYGLGTGVARAASAAGTSPGLLLVGLLPHALPELVALFLPLAAWIDASRRGEWERLLAATVVTVSLALPVLVVTALWEVFVAPHLLAVVLGYR